MPNLPTFPAKIAVTILAVIILIYFVGKTETFAQKNAEPSSPFKQCWELTINQTNQTNLPNIASDNKSNIYLSLSNGIIESIDSKSGEKNWKSELGGEIISPFLVDNKNVYVISQIKTNIFVRSLSKNFGITTWQTNFDVIDFSEGLFFVKDNNYLVIGGKNGKFFVIDKNNGTIIWSRNLELKLLSAPVLSKNRIIFGTTNNKIFFLSIVDGNILFQFTTVFSPYIVAVIEDRYLFWDDHKGNTYLTDLITKRVRWKIRSGAEVSNIYVTQTGLLISSLDNFIYLISLEKGKLIWKKRFEGRLSFSPLVNNRIIIITFASRFIHIVDIKTGRLVNWFVVQEDSQLINKLLVLDDLFVFLTLKGLIGITDARNGCVLKRESGK